ncbi:MAG: hypothetical protein QXS48_01565 [Candidatus Aenigmatarchaeota archaeon]
MPEVWVYVVGGIVISILILAIAYHLISSAINFSQKQNTLSQFSDLFTDINSVCVQEINNSLVKKYRFEFQTRVVFSTDEKKIPIKVVDLIKNQNLSSGYNLCLQFKDENYLRCQKLYCNLTMPYLGVLPEKEDIWVSVSKILGSAPFKEYELEIKKISSEKVNITIR